MLCKNDLHPLRGPADYVSGECKQCWQQRQDRYRARRDSAMSVLKDIEKRARFIRSTS